MCDKTIKTIEEYDDGLYIPDLSNSTMKELRNYMNRKEGMLTIDETDKYYLGIAKAVSEKSTCLRRKFGAIIVKNDVIVGTGFNGPARGCTHCDKLGCIREKLGVERGQRYELCRSVHAEQNAIINAHNDIIGGTIYLYCETEKNIEPCIMCKRVILNAQLSRLVTPEKVFDIRDFIDADIEGHDNYADVSRSITNTALAMNDVSISLNDIINFFINTKNKQVSDETSEKDIKKDSELE